MALTQQEYNDLLARVISEVVNHLEQNSTSELELERVSSLTGVDSLPASRGLDMVRVPIELLGKPAVDAAATAQSAATSANDASRRADSAANNANSAASAADTARAKAETATDNANDAAQNARDQIATIAQLQSGLDDERTQRRSDVKNLTDGQQTLSGNLTSETAARIAADNAEASARQQADQSEQAARTNADAELHRLLEAETEERKTAYTALKNTVDSLVGGNATAAIDSLQEVLTFLSEVTDTEKLSGLLQDLSGRISREVVDRMRENTDLGNRLNQAVAELKNLISQNSTAIANHKSGNTLNVTERWPLPDGQFYTLSTAIRAVEERYRVKGAVVTYETASGLWETRQYVGTDASGWTDETQWQEFGGGGKIKAVRVDGQPLTPDAQGAVDIQLPLVPTVDDTLQENSTNPVSGGAVAAKFRELTSSYGAALQLNETGSGADKAFSISLLDQEGRVLSQTDQFTGGGGGTVQPTKIVLTRLTPSQTVKRGTPVRLSYRYDHVSTDTGETTGNACEATWTLTRGAYSVSERQTVAAGSTATIDLSALVDTGVNTLRLRLTVGEGAEQQVASLTWTVTVVELRLSSSFKIETLTPRGQVLRLPYALVGSGSKTLRLLVDGLEREQRTILTSTASGEMAVQTTDLVHGTHSLQLVAELDTGSTLIRSNSLRLDVAIMEEGHREPLLAARWDDAAGRVYAATEQPTLTTRQWEAYEVVYAAFTPSQPNTAVRLQQGGMTLAETTVGRTRQTYNGRATAAGTQPMTLTAGTATLPFTLAVEQSHMALSDPTDGLALRLEATGRSNADTDRAEWRYNDIPTTFENLKWGGDGWTGRTLRLTGDDRATVHFQPFGEATVASHGLAILLRFRVTDVTDEAATVVQCMDDDGVGFTLTTQEARMTSQSGATVATKFAAGETYEVGFVAWPRATADSSTEERRHDGMMYLYVDGILSGAVQRAEGDSLTQRTPQPITMGSADCALELLSLRCYNTRLTDSQMLDAYITHLDTVDEMIQKYTANDLLDAATGEISPERLGPLPYIIVTGQQENGEATLLQAAVNNNKKTKYNVDEILYVNPSQPQKNFVVRGGMIQLQGTSSLAYPTKNYKIFTYGTDKQHDPLYIGCNAQGVGGTLQEDGLYSFRDATKTAKAAAPVDCWCLKADYAESSSSHNTGMANIVQRALTAAGELTPAQKYVDKSYTYEVRTTVDGFPIALFYRKTATDKPTFLGKYNFNNDKSTEAVFGFRDIPGYHDAAWVQEKFSGQNPVECWEFLNNDYPMGMFLEADFEAVDTDGTPKWQKVWEGRFPDGHTDSTQLARVAKWINGCKDNPTKFKAEVADYFDVPYLCDYYMLTEMFGAVDQRVKNMMLAFYYNPEKGKVLGYFIFYDNDTIMGLRNDGRLKYLWDINENTIDHELSTPDRTVYAYAGHDSVLWNNVRAALGDELQAAYVRLRRVMTNDFILNIFDKEQSEKFCERMYNKDAVLKYVVPKTEGVRVVKDGSVTQQKYSYLEAMQGSRMAHRHWWLRNRLAMLDAKYATGQYTATDLTFKGNSAAGATIRAWASRPWHLAMAREGQLMTHDKVEAGQEWHYTYDQVANIGTIFHFYGGEYASKIDLSEWGGFTDLTLPQLPRLETLVMGREGSTYPLTEFVVGGKLPVLRSIDMTGYASLPSLDLSGCTLLERVVAKGCTALSLLTLPQGAPLTDIELPHGYQQLALLHLPRLRREGISIPTLASITSLRVEGCAQIDGLALLEEARATPQSALRYVRVDGVAREGTGQDLTQLWEDGLRGIREDGSADNDHCHLMGTYQLTELWDEEALAELRAHFPSLTITQPPYSVYTRERGVETPASFTNEDNRTGYRYDTTTQARPYTFSGHAKRIADNIHSVIGKQTAKDVMRVYPLHDLDRRVFADHERVEDCTPATPAPGEPQGDTFTIVPRFWYKGINDYTEGRDLFLYSSQQDKPQPRGQVWDVPMDVVKEKSYLAASVANVSPQALTNSNNYQVLRCPVPEGARLARFQPQMESQAIQSCFTDGEGKRLWYTLDNYKNTWGACDGMDIVVAVPEGAKYLWVTFPSYTAVTLHAARFGEYIDDMEDWVERPEMTLSTYLAAPNNNEWHSQAGLTSRDAAWYPETEMMTRRGFLNAPYDDWKDVLNLAAVMAGGPPHLLFGVGSRNYRGKPTGQSDPLGARGHTINSSYIDNLGVSHPISTSAALGFDNIGVQVWVARKGWWDARSLSATDARPDRAPYWNGAPSGGGLYSRFRTHGRYMDWMSCNDRAGSGSTYLAFQTSLWAVGSPDIALGFNRLHQAGVELTEYSFRIKWSGRIEYCQSVEEYKATEPIFN